jgi:type II secretory pathway component GspD/PulD (secretin)
MLTSLLPSSRTWLAAALLVAFAPALPGQEAVVKSIEAQEPSDVLTFSFEGAPWREVIKWLADACDLALHVGDLPTGSFTYFDPNPFTQQEAIDRVNLFLLPEGFTMVRSGKLLSVINLSDPRGLQQIDTLAKLVTTEQLENLQDHDVVKCIFPLGELKAADAVEELTALKLMMPPAVFTKTNQLMITDTAGKLKNVRIILSAFEPHMLENGTVVKSFALQHADAEDILLVARPHLGLATGEMIGIDVSLSADIQGKNIFATGIEDKVKLIESLIESLDKPSTETSLTDGDAVLQSHIIAGGNVETVYNVLQTLLAGKTVRLSTDDIAGTVIALATPDIQAQIADTVAQLQATESEFAVIPLKTIDPYLAVSLLEEMFDLADAKRRNAAGIDAFTRHGNSRGVDLMNSSEGSDVPKIDADPVNRRLFVWAKKHQIEQIKKIVAELDSGNGINSSGSLGASSSSNDIRIFPIRGKQAEQILTTVAKFWREGNPIFYYPLPADPASEENERIINQELTFNQMLAQSQEPQSSPARLLTLDPDSKEAVIRCQLTPRGLLLQSEDTAALDLLEEHLRTIAGPGDSLPSPPVVFYLKYTRPDDALRMLAELLDGGEAAKESESGALVNGSASTLSGLFTGSILMSRDGTLTMIAGSITVVADTRLNRLIAQGTAFDIERIEGYLKIVDKDNSITSIETRGTSRVIELVHTKAAEVAAVIREAYGDRVTGGDEKKAPATAADVAREAALAKAKAATEESSGTSSKTESKNLEPTMTIAVHERSNSLIVTAPDRLFEEVELLAMLIDSRSKEEVKVIDLPDGVDLDTLQRVLSGELSTGSTSKSSKSKSR